MPSILLPTDFYGPEISSQLRLSSKSHWDVPVRIGSTTIHLLAAHPTPPNFDGPEKRNQRRNHDEIRLWADYLRPGRTSEWIVDDDGVGGGLDIGRASCRDRGLMRGGEGGLEDGSEVASDGDR